jgi:hypothetical protein
MNLVTGRILLWVAAGVLVPATAARPAHTPDANPLSLTPQVKAAFDHFYNLEYDQALDSFEKVQLDHPGDPIATDYVLDVVIFRELNRLDLLDTTFYANDGFLSGKHTVVEDDKVRDQVRTLADQAVAEANQRLEKNSEDVNALYARGWARSLDATYIAMVERGFASALHVALGARSDNVEVLRLDPNYVDANLVVGTYQYVVGALPFSFRLLIGMAGIKGNKEKGLGMLRLDAAHGVTTSVEARTCLMLFLRRDGKYADALQIAHTLAAEYPHDFLFKLEEANLSKDAGSGVQAIDLYRQLIKQTGQPGYYHSSHPELAYFGLGDSLRGQKLFNEAVEAYRSAADAPKTSPELKRRCLLAAGKSYDLMQDHQDAVAIYQQVIDAGSDTVQAEDARKLMRKGFTN